MPQRKHNKITPPKPDCSWSLFAAVECRKGPGTGWKTANTFTVSVLMFQSSGEWVFRSKATLSPKFLRELIWTRVQLNWFVLELSVVPRWNGLYENLAFITALMLGRRTVGRFTQICEKIKNTQKYLVQFQLKFRNIVFLKHSKY